MYNVVLSFGSTKIPEGFKEDIDDLFYFEFELDGYDIIEGNNSIIIKLDSSRGIDRNKIVSLARNYKLTAERDTENPFEIVYMFSPLIIPSINNTANNTNNTASKPTAPPNSIPVPNHAAGSLNSNSSNNTTNSLNSNFIITEKTPFTIDFVLAANLKNTSTYKDLIYDIDDEIFYDFIEPSRDLGSKDYDYETSDKNDFFTFLFYKKQLSDKITDAYITTVLSKLKLFASTINRTDRKVVVGVTNVQPIKETTPATTTDQLIDMIAKLAAKVTELEKKINDVSASAESRTRYLERYIQSQIGK